MPFGSVPTRTVGSVGSGVAADGPAEAVGRGGACCAPDGAMAARETSAAVAKWMGVLDMVECYPVEALPLPSDIVGLGDSVRFSAPVAESTQIRGQNLLRIHMRFGTEMRRRAASYTTALLFGVSLLSCSENPIGPANVRPGAAR